MSAQQPDQSGNIPVKTDRSNRESAQKRADPDDEQSSASKKRLIRTTAAVSEGVKVSSNKVADNFTDERGDPTGIVVEEKEYMIDPDEINELFRSSQQNNGGLIV